MGITTKFGPGLTAIVTWLFRTAPASAISLSVAGFAAARNRLTTNFKFIVRWLGVIVSALSVIFAILTYLGLWNFLRGDNLLADVAARFDRSYAEDAGLPVRPGDKEWRPLMRVVTRYSHAQLPTDKQPRVFARSVAVTSARNEAARAEWTAPSTPIMLLYKEWPGHGLVTPDDYRIVGTIEDLHNWIRNDEADFDFLVRTIIFGVLSLCVGVFLALPDKQLSSKIGLYDDHPKE
jgi:hypothetical protein